MDSWPNSYDILDDEDSSDPGNSSSEDEINIILHGTPDQKRKLKRLQDRVDERHQENDKSSSSEDEFEREMNDELTQHMGDIEKNRGASKGLSLASASRDQDEEQDLFYDDVYFDSDEEGNKDGIDSSKHAIISNDDLLCDPTMDDRDQRWVDKQRRRNNNTCLSNSSSQNKRKKPAKLPTSDALLDCPACMTTLCLDCQRHDTYKHQYRAMFVMNCVVDSTQMLECPDQQTKRKKKKKKTSTNSEAPPSASFPTETVSGSDLFHPVKCTECNTVVGVIDSDEIYHFFNVLASHT